jgi:signal transduction histidine kinase
MWRILVVEDDAVDREATRRVLEASGQPVSVREVADGQACLAALDEEPFDCVLLDFRLPDMDGLDVLRAQSKGGGAAPVLMMTGEGSEEVAVKAMQLGAADYIVKHNRLSGQSLAGRIRLAMERAALRRDKEAAEMALAASHAELEQFAYSASHDLQEPLRMVRSYLQLLERRYGDSLDAAAHEYIGFAVDGAERMQHLIDDLLQLSRLNRKTDGFVPVDLGKVLTAVRRDLEGRLAEGGGDLTVETLPTVLADEIQMVRLFDNLIGNALKYRHPDRPPMVHVAAAARRGGWQITVRDNGIGIEPRFFDRIFMVFQRLHSRREYQGTGIGLALAKKIAERHGGRIWVTSQPGVGSAFHVFLPALPTVGDVTAPATPAL